MIHDPVRRDLWSVNHVLQGGSSIDEICTRTSEVYNGNAVTDREYV